MNSPEEPLVGQILAGYRIEALISRDAGGVLYRATQIAIQRTVALKVLAPELASNKKLLLRFVREARDAAKLHHPHVVQIHDVRHDEGHVFYSMEHLPGGTLADWVAEEGGLPARAAVTVLEAAASAVRYAEERGLVHPDLWPARILLAADRRLKVHGFVAREHAAEVAGASSAALDEPSPRAAAFLAPEQLLESTVDGRTAVYSLGCIAYFTLTGRPPFTGDSVKTVLSAKVVRPPPPLEKEKADIPLWLSALIARMISRDPTARPADSAEVIAILSQQQGGAAPGGPREPGQGTARSTVRAAKMPRPVATPLLRRLPAQIALAAASLSMLVVFLVLLYRRGHPTGAPSGENESGLASSRPRGAAKDRPDARDVSSEPRAAVTEGAPGSGQAETAGTEASVPERGEAEVDALRAVVANWRAKLLTHAEAREAVERLRARSAAPKLTEAAEKALKEIAGAQAAAAGARVAKEIDSKLERQRYAEAYAAVEKLRSDPDLPADVIAAHAARVEAAALDALSKAEAKALELGAAGKLDAATTLLVDLAVQLPEPLARKAHEQVGELTRAAARSVELESGLAAAEAGARRLLADLKIDAAEKAVADLPAGGPASYAARREAIAAEIALARRAVDQILAGAQEAAKAPRVTLTFDPFARERPPFSGRILEVGPDEKGVVRLKLESTGSPPDTCDIFDLANETLVGFLDAPRGGNPPPVGGNSAPVGGNSPPVGGSSGKAELVEGLGLVLWHRQGPRRAWSLLSPAGAPPEARKAGYAARLLADGAAALTADTAALVKQVEGLAAQPSADGTAAWEELAASAERLLARHAGMPYYAGRRASLLDAYRRAKRECSRSMKDLASLVHGRARLGTDGVLKLRYEFSDPDQINDFVVHSGSAKLEHGMLVVSGEARLLAADPFREWIRVTFRTAGYNPQSPNINVAVWTRDDDRVTFDGWSGSTVAPSATGGAATGGNTPPPATGTDDYFAFCTGYQPRGRETSIYDLLYIRDLNRVVPMPAFALLAGTHLKRLHAGTTSTYRLECIWGESVLNKVKGPQQVQILLKPDSFDWFVNNVRMSRRAVQMKPQLGQALARTGAVGSITLFTNGFPVQFAALEVEGVFNPDWVEAMASRQAEIRWAELESRAAPAPSTGSSPKPKGAPAPAGGSGVGPQSPGGSR